MPYVARRTQRRLWRLVVATRACAAWPREPKAGQPPVRIVIGLVAGRASASSLAPNWKKVVLHLVRRGVHRDVPTVRRRRVILLRRKPSSVTNRKKLVLRFVHRDVHLHEPAWREPICFRIYVDSSRRYQTRHSDRLTSRVFFGNRTLEENSPDRPLLRVALTPGFAVTDHRAAYDVAVLADPGGVGPAMLPPPPCRLEATPK